MTATGCAFLGMAQDFDGKGGDEDGTDTNRATVSAEDGISKDFDIRNPLV